MSPTVSSTRTPSELAPPSLTAQVQPAAAAPGEVLVAELTDVTRANIALVGGKGANLGEMMRAELPVPPGFVLTVDAYERFRAATGIGARIDALLRDLRPEDTPSLQLVSAELQSLVTGAVMPPEIVRAIEQAYDRLAARQPDAGEPVVAVRSSATAEDTTEFSFAGMFESVLGVRGKDALFEAIHRCWASTFGSRVLYYRLTRGMPGEMPVAVVVQRMVRSEKAGVMFTADPATGKTENVVIEAAWGLGEVVVGGQVRPDRYVVVKGTGAVQERSVGTKDFLLDTRPEGGTRRVDLAGDPRAVGTVLTDAELATLARLAVSSERHYGAPQDMEFAIAGADIFITQTRPITTLARAANTPARAEAPAERREPLLRGLGASPGTVTGRVRLLHDMKNAQSLQQGEILVTEMTSPDWVPLMRRAGAIVTNAGGMTSHAAIVSRELGIPCIVGTRTATTVLRDGTQVTVDGREGTVFAGAMVVAGPVAKVAPPPAPAATPLVTGTRLYVNLADPARAVEIAARDVDGVGLLRAEFMMLSALDGVHPRSLIEADRTDEFVRRMTEGLRTIAAAFAPRPVVYRAMDFRTNEFRQLKGGEHHEPVEANPMIGYRGCFRYTREPDLFGLELLALATVRREHPNLHLMIPFVRTGREMRRVRALIDGSALAGAEGLELWVMAEVPSVVSWMDEYVRLGVTGVSIGSNDLTQLVLGVDRDSALLGAEYDERDRAVQDAIRAIITRAHDLGITASICGQAPSIHPEFAERLVSWGIDSISVDGEAIERTRRHVAAAELRVLLRSARGAAR